jgi:hypothetical protein
MKLSFAFSFFVSATAEQLVLKDFRPAATTWKRTKCGSPSGSHPAVPASAYTIGMDYAGDDMDPCGGKGCVLDKAATNADCAAKCKGMQGCAGYVFAPTNCSGTTGPICWPKSAMVKGAKNNCRNSEVFAQPASGGADIPSKWASEVSADKTPLVAYPRPQMVRGGAISNTTSFEELRDTGDASSWTNLNGLWQWEPAMDKTPPIGKTLSGSILVPFPVESCLSGVAPAKSADIVKQMWYRLTFDATRHSSESVTGGKTLLHFGAIDWQSAVYLNGKLLGNHTGGYDGFDYDVSDSIKTTGNELLVYAFDPSDGGVQPNGKQKISAIDNPGGDTYTPSSGNVM